MNETREWFESIDWGEKENVKILSLGDDDRVIATLEIRGEEFTLLFYDYYMLHAILLTDGASSAQIDFDYVVKLRYAIREDMNHFLGILSDILYSYEGHNLLALDKIIEIVDDYTESICNAESLDFNVQKRSGELHQILIKANGAEK